MCRTIPEEAVEVPGLSISILKGYTWIGSQITQWARNHTLLDEEIEPTMRRMHLIPRSSLSFL